jgi:serine phosphatase RsbU (regulator of sigma subunit)/anti-sigma regulatory factor (Ser/Thr protein kinase)
MLDYLPLFILELLIAAGGFILVRRLMLAASIYKSKKHLESAFDSIEDPLAIIRRDYSIIRVNKAYSELVGKPFSEVIGGKCYNILRNRESPCEDCRIKHVFHTERKQYIPISTHPSLPETRNISISFYSFHPKTGADASIVEHIRDITELEYLKDNLEKRNKSLSDTTVVLKKAQAEMNDELELARQIQRSSLPQKPPGIEGIRISAAYHPIKAVGGDIYDYIPFSKDRLALFIGDASGHGLPSAFISTMSKMLLYNNSREELPPATILNRINRDLLQSVRSTYYLTAICAVFDMKDNSIVYARAGHPKPFVIKSDGTIVYLESSGTFIGILENAVYEQRKFHLHKGDRVFFCTDGIYEVFTNEEKNSETILGYRQFAEIIASVNHLPFDEIIPAAQKKLECYEYEDDYTLIMAEITEECPAEAVESFPGLFNDKETGYFISEDFTEIVRQTEAIITAMSKHNWSVPDSQYMKMCINELVANAIEHGNCNDSRRKVTIAYDITDEEMNLCVSDEGEGFKIDAVPDPTHQSNLAKEGGRGLFLIRKFVDSIEQNTKGNCVCVTKKKQVGSVK